MTLPPAGDLSRWTVSHVNNWLTESSLAVFRDNFLREGIDGSKLLRMNPSEIDIKYNDIPLKKRQILKDHLGRIGSLRSPPASSWNAGPQLPPRPGLRAPAPLPQAPQDESDDGDMGWDSDFDDESSDEEYLKPTTKPVGVKEAQGRPQNGHQQLPPDPGENLSDYENPDGLEDVVRQGTGLQRRATLVDRLKNELYIRKRDSQVDTEPPPPPRPPRGNKSGPELPSYTNSQSDQPGRRRPPEIRPQAEVKAVLPPDDVYEIPHEEDKSMERGKKELPPLPGGEIPLPPRPGKKGDKPPQPPPPTQQGGWLFNSDQTSPAASGDDLSSYEWYHGKIGRDHADRIFQREQKDGMFLIRKSERDPQQPYTLVIWHIGRMWNIPIRKVDNNKFAAGKYKEGETQFNSIVELVEHFKVVSLNLKSDNKVQGTHNLKVPAPKH